MSKLCIDDQHKQSDHQAELIEYKADFDSSQYETHGHEQPPQTADSGCYDGQDSQQYAFYPIMQSAGHSAISALPNHSARPDFFVSFPNGRYPSLSDRPVPIHLLPPLTLWDVDRADLSFLGLRHSPTAPLSPPMTSAPNSTSPHHRTFSLSPPDHPQTLQTPNMISPLSMNSQISEISPHHWSYALPQPFPATATPLTSVASLPNHLSTYGYHPMMNPDGTTDHLGMNMSMVGYPGYAGYNARQGGLPMSPTPRVSKRKAKVPRISLESESKATTRGKRGRKRDLSQMDSEESDDDSVASDDGQGESIGLGFE
jgi:hypothetical protein